MGYACIGGVGPLPSVAEFDFHITVDLGRWLFFRVTDFGTHNFDTTFLSLVIYDNVQTAIPEPGAHAALLGLPLALRLRRRRR